MKRYTAGDLATRHSSEQYWRQARTKGILQGRERIIADGPVALCGAARFAISDKNQEASDGGSGQFAQKMRKAALAVFCATAVAFVRFCGFRRQFLARSAIPRMIHYSPASLRQPLVAFRRVVQQSAEFEKSAVKARFFAA
jgi:hypothetical protein